MFVIMCILEFYQRRIVLILAGMRAPSRHDWIVRVHTMQRDSCKEIRAWRAICDHKYHGSSELARGESKAIMELGASAIQEGPKSIL